MSQPSSIFYRLKNRASETWTPLEAVALLLMFLPLFIYWCVSLSTDRIFFFEDDLIRISLARYYPGMPIHLLAWGYETAWPPGGMVMQALAQLILPFGLKADVLFANLCWIYGAGLLVHRLARRIEPGIPSLFPVLLLLTSPTAIWLATSALVEPFFLATLLLEVLFLVRYFENRRFPEFAAATACSFVLTMIRFEGWVIGPGLLAAVVLVLLWQRRANAWPEAVLSTVTLLPPIGWMIGSWVRYGDALQFAKDHTRRLEEFYIAGSPVAFQEAFAGAFFQVTDVGWIFFLAALVVLCYRIARRDEAARSAVATVTLGGFLCSFLLFLYFSLGKGYGLFQPRFIFVWYGAGLPLTVFLFRKWRKSLQNTIFAIAALVCLFSAIMADQFRPDIRQSHGLLALATIEEHIPEDEEDVSLRFLVPPDRLDYAEGAVLLYAPSVSDRKLLFVGSDLEESAQASGADFLMLRKEYFPEATSLNGYELIYEDDYYRAFERASH